MSEPESSPDRLVFFNDAVAAIAITLLVLPLLDVITGSGQRESFGHMVRDHIGEFGAFVLSFAVIFRFWWAHHRLFQHVSTISAPLVAMSVVWTFGIAWLPIPTAIISAYRASAGTVALYGGTLVLINGALTTIALHLYRHQERSTGRSAPTREAVLGNVIAFGAQVLATVIGCVFADTINYWAFLLIFLTGPADALVKARSRKGQVRR